MIESYTFKMDYVKNIDCPQYVDFKAVFNKTEDSFTDTAVSSGPVKDDMDSESMNVDSESENSYQDSPSSSMLSTLSPYSANNFSQQNVGDNIYLKEDFPVNRPKNLSLPENKQKNVKKNKTVVKPFHLTESKKRKREDEHIPLAEQIIAFHKKTPERFHTTGAKAFEPTEHWSPQMVRPVSPNLRAAKRRRKINVLSREEQEAKEIEEIKGYKFRARPINHNILNNPRLPKVAKKFSTRPKDLNLKTAERAAEIQARKKVEEKPYEFHARPVPKVILNGPTGLKEKSKLPVTEAKTPNFALKTRAAKWKSENKLNDAAESQLFKALPAPAPASPFKVKHEKKCTEIQPFSFDAKDKEKIAKKEQKIAEEIEKENKVYQFKAQPLPNPSPCSLPPVQKKQLTRPQPFNLHSGKNSRHNSLNLSVEQSCPIFKAQPATVLEKPPFVPEKPAKQPTEIKEFHLYTDRRASERLKLKEIYDMKEHEKELLLQRHRELQEEEERKEIMKIRKEAVHKANPIRHYNPVEIKPSDKMLTMPVSPKFRTDQRIRSRDVDK